MEQKIKGIAIITSAGMGHCFTVGVNGVTEISEYIRQIGEYQFVYTFRIYKEKELVCEISKLTPFVNIERN